MNILALDYGKKRIGLAWVDTDVNVVLPFGVVTAENTDAALERLEHAVREEKIDTIVIGLPIGLDGKENQQTAVVRSFGEFLAKRTGTPIFFVDERFTTSAAARTGDSAVTKDEQAAMLILQSYIEGQRE